ncbi:GNAT family N-acetyltransferase [Plantactinospora sp. GCM10030261]|uniref:GNAT family N-acetyltransferase n=1 Tax=Plantactinospora sp. GCM10030261 TaxID=3273420 RepID=UPI00360AFB3F
MAVEISVDALTDRDVPALIELCRAALDLPEDAAEAAEIVTGLAARRAATHPAVGLVARARDEVRGVAIGSLADRMPGHGHVDLVAVHPAVRREGAGRALLASLETALARRGATEVLLAGNPPHYAWPGVDVRYTPAICLAEALGYRHDRTAWNMTVDLTDPDAPGLRDPGSAERRLADQGITVRAAGPADVPALVALAREFGGEWAGELTGSVGSPGAGCHLAVRGDGELLGFAAYGSGRPSWFGPTGTAPAARGLGIGAVLLRRCLRDQRAAGVRRAQISWVGPVPFYARVADARIERVFFLFRKQLAGTGAIS